MKRCSIGLMIYGAPGTDRNALTEEKYRKLAAHFIDDGFLVDSIVYHDSLAGKLEKELLVYNAILVWVNPIEQQGDRQILDALLAKLSNEGCFVSAHPDTILKMGTKEILFKTRNADFGSDVKLYSSFVDFKDKFFKVTDGIRILKQYRGNGGKGVFKIDKSDFYNDRIGITEATAGNEKRYLTVDDFFTAFESYFKSGNMLIDQAWNPNIINGMVRCYLCGNKVAGFGYQEINALYPVQNGIFKNPGHRFYFTENCSLFGDLRQIMEQAWIKQLQDIAEVKTESLPAIWDADFFIDSVNGEEPKGKYSLCEINVSSVSPFPESSIPYIVKLVRSRIG